MLVFAGIVWAAFCSEVALRMVFEYQGTPVMACKVDGHWQVRAQGNIYEFRFLDQALSAALPSLTRREVDQLLISLIDQEMQRDETLFDAA